MRHRKYGIKDFVSDPSFQKWVLAPDDGADAFWREWLDNHPDKQLVVQEAKRIILLLGFTTDAEANEKLLRGWKVLDDAWVAEKKAKKPRGRILYSPSFRVAAALVILIAATITLWPFLNRTVTVHTRFGELKSFTLPDGSVVDMNANSSIEYLKDWNQKGEREVWLQGEAFFSVTHDPDKKFIVHTADGIHVNVLGTTFNVMSRRKRTRVSLNTGKIMVRADETFLKHDKRPAKDSFVMVPGEVAEFDANTSKIMRQTAAAEHYTMWKEKKMVFDNTAMKDVAVMLEDTYGLKVHVHEPLKMRRITGEFRSDDLDILLQFIAKALHANVDRNAHEIRFRNRDNKP